MANGSSISGIIGNSVGEAAAFAAGVAVGPLLEPVLQSLRNTTWSEYPDRPLDPEVAAQAVAEAILTLDEGEAEAKLSGLALTPFKTYVETLTTAPGTGELLNMLRRGTISSGNFTHGLRKAALQPMWHTALAELAVVYPGIGDIAYGVVRGILPSPKWVPVAPPAHGDKVKRFPVVDIDPVALAAKLGYDEDMLRLMVGRSGLSIAPVMAAQAAFRQIIGPDDFLLAIAEGDLRTEWADAVLAVSREILTASQYAELQLRGFLTPAQREAGTAKHGMSPADSQLLYDVLGRAPNIHAVTTGLARGGTYDGKPKTIPEPFLAAVERANIRPEWYDIEYANRYSYPSGFQIKSEAPSDGYDFVHAMLLKIGWEPDIAAHYAEKWTGAAGTGAKADPHVAKAATQLWTTTYGAYKATEIGKSAAQANLTVLGIDVSAQTEIFDYWDAVRSTVRHQISVAQLLKAEKDGITNPATRLPYTNADVIAALVDRGYDQADATVMASE